MLAKLVAGIDYLVPLLDVGFIFFWVPGVILFVFGYPLIFGWWSMLLLPITLTIFGLLRRWQEHHVFRRLDIHFGADKRGFFGLPVRVPGGDVAGFAARLRAVLLGVEPPVEVTLHLRLEWSALNTQTHIASQAVQVEATVYTADVGGPKAILRDEVDQIASAAVMRYDTDSGRLEAIADVDLERVQRRLSSTASPRLVPRLPAYCRWRRSSYGRTYRSPFQRSSNATATASATTGAWAGTLTMVTVS